MRILSALAAFIIISSAVYPKDVLTLQKSMDIAFGNNIQLNISEEKIQQSKFVSKEAATSFFPRLSSSFTYTRLNEAQEASFGPFPPLLPDPISYTVADDNLYNLNIEVNQVLFTGGKRTAIYRQALENVTLMGYQKDSVKQEVAYDVKKSYFSLLKSKRLLENALSLRDMTEQHLKVAELSFKEGLVTRIDILKTEVFLSEAQQAIIQAESAVRSAESAFNFVLNRPLDTKADIEDIFTAEKELRTLDYWTNFAFAKHPDLKVADCGLKISEFNISAAKSGYYPQIAAFYNYVFDKGTQEPFDEWRDTWNIGVAVSLDIWNWGETRYKTKQAEHYRKEIEEQKTLLKNVIELNVKNAYINIETATKEIKTAAKTVEKAQENHRITGMLYKEGMATTTEVLDAQTDLTSARNNYYQALYNYHIAYAEIEKAAGITD